MTPRPDHIVQQPGNELIEVLIESFGYAHHNAPPALAHLVVDLRDYLPDPATDQSIRDKTGLYPDIAADLLALPGAQSLAEDLVALTLTLHDQHDPRLILTRVAIGSHRGRHRSVAMANQVMHALILEGVATSIVHRDILRAEPTS